MDLAKYNYFKLLPSKGCGTLEWFFIVLVVNNGMNYTIKLRLKLSRLNILLCMGISTKGDNL